MVQDSEHLIAAISSTGDGIITTDDAGRVLFINSRAQELTGWSEEDACQKPLDDVLQIIDGKSQRPIEGLFSRSRGLSESIGLKKNSALCTKTGKVMFISASCAPIIKDGQPSESVVVVFRDITRILSMEMQMSREWNRMFAIFDSAPIGVVILDKQSIIRRMNRTLTTITGRQSDELLGKPFGKGFGCKQSLEYECGQGPLCEACPFRQLVMKVLDSRHEVCGVEIETNLLAKDGNTTLWMKASAVPILVEEEWLVVVVLDDITASKEYEAQIQNAAEAAKAASKAKSEFLANMSHEIRTPLNGVIGMTNLTLLTELTKEQQENLQIIKNCADSLLNVINNILDYSKIEAGKVYIIKNSFSLHNLVKKTVSVHALRAKEKYIELRSFISKNVPDKFIGDEYRLQQILHNLLGNALKFTEQGSIVLTVETIRQLDNRMILKFAIADSGIGIAPEEMDRLFKSFSQVDASVTRKYGGTGLGLAISKQLVELMGGEIRVDSAKGRGSLFSFTVELERDLSREPVVLAEIKTSVRQEPRPLAILLAEDDPINQRVILQMLKKHGHKVTLALDGSEAVTAAGKAVFDAILMDIQMPEMDGVEATKRIRNHEQLVGKYTPIIALTACALQGDRERFLAAGMDEYLAKPFEMEKLFNLLEKLRPKPPDTQAEQNLSQYLALLTQKTTKGAITEEKEIVSYVQSLSQYLNNGEFNQAESLAHTIKILAGKNHSGDAKELAFKIELALRREDLETARELCAKLTIAVNQ